MEERGLDRSVIAGLDAGNYLGQRLNVVFQGATGSGKSHLLCAWRNPRAEDGTAPYTCACPTSPNR